MNKIELCKQIQTNINRLSNNEIVEIFKIINETDTSYTKNNNGIFLNLNWVDEETLIKIDNYINFCIKSQNEISKYEMMKSLLNDSIKTKDKDIDDSNVRQDVIEINTSSSSRQKFSSSMKFYLLKKKYLKQNNQNANIIENELTYEEYLF
jgi:hypothetical protein